MAFVRSPISYQGSKKKEISYIKEHQPAYFNKLIDVFGGGGNVFLQYIKDYPCHYNDVNKYMVELFTILKDEAKTNDLINDMRKYGTTFEEWTDIKNNKVQINELTKYIYMCKLGMRGNMNLNTPKRQKQNGVYIMTGKNDIGHFKMYPELLRDKLTVTGLDFRRIFEMYKDDENAFLYCDPPYISCKTNEYGTEFTKQDFDYIIRVMRHNYYKCKIMLNVDYCGYTRENFKDLYKSFYPISYNSAYKSGLYNKYHIILTNYDLPNSS
jgi:site-specific DNA-adenine methylase